MDISFWTMPGGFNINMGYGYAAYNMLESLKALGHSVPFNRKEAKVQISFCQPQWFKWHPGQYRIAYTPWESSEVPASWIREFNSCDEVWTTSPLVKEWYVAAGVTRPVLVYQHGIEHIWTPKERKDTGKIKFLFVGEPAIRKDGQRAFDAFIQEFGPKAKDVHLTIKATDFSTIRYRNEQKSIICHVNDIPNVTVITEDYSIDQMVALFHDHDILIYPSWGEGFGFIPLQALATGMPTICTEAWAPYAKYLRGLGIKSDMVDSPWQNPHSGKMFRPDITHMRELMRDVVDNYDKYAADFYSQAQDVHDEYDWINLTRGAFQHIFDRFDND